MNIVLDYLVKISKKQNTELIQRILNDQIRIQMKIYGSNEIYKVRIRPSVQNKIYVIQFKGNAFSENEALTFRIDIDTRIFFFKTMGLSGTKSIQLNQESEIYELVRRKEPRFKLPQEWPQFSLVMNTITKNVKATAEIVEISNSGMKLILRPEVPRFETGQKIKVQFKIYKRAQIVVDATIKHSRKNKTGGPTIGIEFNSTTHLAQVKIQNVLDDISFYYTHLSNKI